MSLLSFCVAVIAVFVMVSISRSVNKNSAFTSIADDYYELFDNEDSFTEEQWERRLTSFNVAVSKFKNNYKRDRESVEQVDRWLNILMGFDPATGEFVGNTEQDKHDKNLIATAKDEIIDLFDIVFEPPAGAKDARLSLTLKNRSDWIVSEVRMAFDAFDSEGNPSNGSVRGDNRWHVRASTPIRPEDTDDLLFLNRWDERDIASVKLVWMDVEYGPNRVTHFPAAVCEVLWP